jgi:lysophospholipase L1-like esterase
MKVLFQGDSITDAGRNRELLTDLGPGYPACAAALMTELFPTLSFTFTNRGISGNRTEHLVERLQQDFIDLQPELVILMIGVNDVWHHYAFEFVETTDDQFEANYRRVLDNLKSRTNARILMIQPFLLENVDPGKQILCEELARKKTIVKKLADEYADAFLPLDEVLHTQIEEEPAYYSADGVHPTPDGACYIGEAYLRAIAPMIELLSKEED